MNRTAALAIGLVGLSTLACASGPKAPFDTLKTANVTAFRLQNFDPPPPPPGAAAPTPQQGMIPGLPPEIAQMAQMAQQALPGLQAFLPPGLVPPGMLAGAAPAAPPPAPPPDAPRFPMTQPNFRILGQAQVMDPALREELGKLFGDPDNFQANHAPCMYGEMGLSFSSGGPPNDMVISFSCHQVQARSFAWPHPNQGLKSETVEKLIALSQKIWPIG